jgi:dTDP-4-amino-4,6-dideoxygalactose transaminase
MLVSHYFGFANSLHAVRAWCDARSIALIEDCAHCYFGRAGERSVGAWGDYSTASISKFFPVQEGGVLASDSRTISNLNLGPATLKDQIKGFFDIVETSNKYGGFKGLNTSINFLLGIKKIFKLHTKKSLVATNDEIIEYCDMGRINKKMLCSSFIVLQSSPRKFITEKRRKNYFQYENFFRSTVGARPLLTIKEISTSEISPYVFPLWVDDADRIYQSLKATGLPVFRWDKVWPDTPQLDNDAGPRWSVHVLQLLCHQNLRESDINLISSAILKLLPNQAA